MIRRFIALWVAVSIGFFTVVTPARAFAPVAVLAAPVLVGGGGASWGMGALLGAIGATLAYFQIADSDGNEVRVPLADNPASVPPAPSAPASTSPVLTYNCKSTLVNSPWTTEILGVVANFAACSAMCPGTKSNCTDGICTRCTYGGVPHDLGLQSVTTCPGGYTLSGGNCVLSNSRKAVSDKKCDLTFSASKYLYYDDVDCPTGPTLDHSKAVPGLRSDGDVVFVPGTVNGKPVLLKLLQQRDSVTQAVTERVLEYWEQVGSNVQKTTATLSPTAQIQSVTTSLSPGQLTSPATSPSASTTPDTATTTPQGQTDPTKQPSMTFPDDYARENTTQAIKSGVEQLHRDLTDTTPVDDPLQPPSSSFEDSFFKTTFDGLKGWQLPSHSSQCPTGNIALFGQTYAIDSHCTLISNHWGALQAAMGVVWSLMALFIVLRA